jgi:hypothetical protein
VPGTRELMSTTLGFTITSNTSWKYTKYILSGYSYMSPVQHLLSCYLLSNNLQIKINIILPIVVYGCDSSFQQYSLTHAHTHTHTQKVSHCLARSSGLKQMDMKPSMRLFWLLLDSIFTLSKAELK